MLRKIAVNTVFLSGSQIVSRLIGFLYFVFLARALGVVDFGFYTFTLSLVYNFIPLADFGIERLVLKDISRDETKGNYYLKRLLPLRLIFGVCSYLLVILLGIILDLSSRQLVYLAIFGLALVPQNITFLIVSFLNAKEKMKYMAGANIALIFMTVTFGSLFVFLNFDLNFILFSYPLASFILATFFLFFSKKLGLALGWVIDKNFWRQTIKNSWVFATMFILAVFYLRMSTIVLGVLKGAEITGLFNSAFKFIEAGVLIPQSLALALFPVSSLLINKDTIRLKKIYLKSILILFIFSLPPSLFLIFFPELIVKFAYGANYLPAIPAFSILGIALILFFVNSLAGTIIQNSEKVKNFLPFSFLNFVVIILLCVFLIPKFSLVGAAWAVVGGEIFGLFINNYFVFRLLKND